MVFLPRKNRISLSLFVLFVGGLPSACAMVHNCYLIVSLADETAGKEEEQWIWAHLPKLDELRDEKVPIAVLPGIDLGDPQMEKSSSSEESIRFLDDKTDYSSVFDSDSSSNSFSSFQIQP